MNFISSTSASVTPEGSANIFVKGFILGREGCNLTVNFNGKIIKPIAWIHTHPASWGGGSQSGGDTGTTRVLGVPSVIIGDNVYFQSVKQANKPEGGHNVMSLEVLKSREIPLIYNLKLRK